MTLSTDEGRMRALQQELERLRAMPPMRSAGFYLSIIFGMACLAVAAIVVIIVARPEEDNTVIIAAILGFLSPVMATVLAVMVKDVHTVINSRMSELISATERAASAEGKAAGKLEEKAEEKAKP